jgi:hypothetical protein
MMVTMAGVDGPPHLDMSPVLLVVEAFPSDIVE